MGADSLITIDGLTDCTRVATEHLGLTFVLDHLAKPGIRSRDISGWESAVRTLAALPNVYAKVSGLTMEADWGTWVVADLERAVTVALDCFGPNRLMFGSDCPLVELCGGYGAWLSAARTLLSSLSATEQAAILSDTARSAYQIGANTDG